MACHNSKAYGTASVLNRYPTAWLNRVALCAWLLTLAIAMAYTAFFHDALVNGDWMEVDGFSRIVIPDTFAYRSLLGEDFSLLGFAVAGVKNAIGPALLWKVAQSDWYDVAALNSLLLLATMLYTVRLCEHFRIPSKRARTIVLLLGLMPVMAYYSVGALKELPNIAAMTAFYYHFIKRQTWRWLLMAFVLFLFRYQTIVVLGMFFLVDRYAGNPLRTAVIAMVVVSMAYPLFANFNILSSESTAVFREGSESSSGAAIESVRDKVLVASAAAVAIRLAQSVLEPLVTFATTLSLFEEGSFSVLAFAYVSSLLLALPFWGRTLVRSYRLFFVRRPASRNLISLYALIVLFVVPVGGFSFIHHRYLFPVTALVLIAGAPLRRGTQSSSREYPEGAKQDPRNTAGASSTELPAV
jgi:hypothetical protein